LIDDINNYFELNFYDLNEYYLLEGKIDKGPDLERISRQKARRDSKRHSAHISNSSRVKKLLGKDESYYRDRSEGYNLSSTFESDSETAWLHDGFCDEKQMNTKMRMKKMTFIDILNWYHLKKFMEDYD